MHDQSVNILLIEDDEVDIMNVQRAFKKNQITNPLYVASNGLEALRMLRGELNHAMISPLPEIILLDINMPQMNGIEFLRELRKDESLRNISVFILTTSNEEANKLAAYNFNVAGYILKPIDFNNFVETVSTLDKFWTLCERPLPRNIRKKER